MGVKAIICHISCMSVAVALYGISGVYNHFEINWKIGPILLLVIGFIGIFYCGYISYENTVLSVIKLLALSSQWFCFLFGSVLAIYSVLYSPWYLYRGGAIVCGGVFIGLFKVQNIGVKVKNA